MGGRTEKVAEIIGEALSDYEVDYIPFELTGGRIEKLKKYDSLTTGDFSIFEEKLNELNTGPYDLILMGMPTYGNLPPGVFDEIMNRIEGLEGKKVVVFCTARITGSGTLEYMKSEVEKKEGNVICSYNFRGFFRIGKKEVLEFARQIT